MSDVAAFAKYYVEILILDNLKLMDRQKFVRIELGVNHNVTEQEANNMYDAIEKEWEKVNGTCKNK